VDDGTDRRIGRLAARQYGLVTRRQLIESGLGRGAIARRVQAGRLISVHTGVYAVGHRRTEPLAVAAAAVLAGGPGATLSHSSAVFVWGLTKRWETPAEITVSGDRRPSGVRAHRSQTLTRRDVRHHLGIRVTSPSRTMLDVAPRLTDPALVRAVNDGRHSRYLHVSDLAELLDRSPRHPGTTRLLPFVQAPPGPTRSDLEDGFVAFARRFGLPAPELNTYVKGFLVDALFAAERLIVELDSYEYHQDRQSFESDRERDAVTLSAGYATVRVTWWRLTGTPEREAARLHAILCARRGSVRDVGRREPGGEAA
jgi:hypothetical protein